ncbi:hemin ABC transporter substrate-binding protein [Oceanicoccus sp. KOV_DT_Chl]|uniref:heme/hemin ABC transporter substrate-binding protein n=1 Tax=Oceanicoccus sp. KOV_DT_Chl TaxID=1904639 RepID=UPI000C7BDF16|nr:ABC transporter substrate-binding protein [Oceanicoccus sp. KOV_DT_Chl]
MKFIRVVATRVCLSSLMVLLSLVVNSQQQQTFATIISTDAGVTDVLIALGLSDQLKGVDVTSVVPESLPVARLGYHRTLSTEGLLSLNPDLIIGSVHMGPAETIAALKTYPLTLLQLPIARNAQTLRDNIQRISVTTNKSAQALPLMQSIDQAMAHINQRQLAANSSVAFLLHMEGRGLRLAGLGTTGNDIIEILGGNNVAEHNSYRSVSVEALLSLEPEVIIIAGEQGVATSLLADNPLLQHTPAGQSQRIVAVNSSLLVAGISLQALDVVAALATQLQQVAPR